MRFNGLLVILLTAWIVSVPAVLAQDDPAPAEQDDAATQTTAEDDAGSTTDDAAAGAATDAATDEGSVSTSTEDEEKSGSSFGLYVYAGAGVADAGDINTSILTNAKSLSTSYFSLDDNYWGRAAIGWKLDNGKGDFRLTYNGYAEQSSSFTSEGRQAFIFGSNTVQTEADFPWWHLDIADGLLTAFRQPPQWDPALDDANGDDIAGIDEVRYETPDLAHTRAAPEVYQNNVYNIDATYGRIWGGRRFSGRWWAGLRYYQYEGNMPATAWLNVAQPGVGFTDGTILRVMNFRTTATGWGPTGTVEADFNFFDRLLQLYANAGAAFTLSDITSDSGEFFTMVQSVGSSGEIQQIITAQLEDSRDKSIWQTQAELGIRLNFKFGLEVELAYGVQGYLDAVLTPTTIQIPANVQQFNQRTTAIWSTRDLVYEGYRVGVGFQF